jgi:hypothetical protein
VSIGKLSKISLGLHPSYRRGSRGLRGCVPGCGSRRKRCAARNAAAQTHGRAQDRRFRRTRLQQFTEKRASPFSALAAEARDAAAQLATDAMRGGGASSQAGSCENTAIRTLPFRWRACLASTLRFRTFMQMSSGRRRKQKSRRLDSSTAALFFMNGLQPGIFSQLL